MKKLLLTLALAVSSSAFAAGFVELALDSSQVEPRSKDYASQTIRAGTTIGDKTTVGFQSKTFVVDAGGLANVFEGYVGRRFDGIPFTPFVGVGHDNGMNGAVGKSYNYGVVGATYATKVSAFNVGGIVKTRVNWEDNKPQQTVVGAFVGYPINKQFEARLNLGKSFQDMKEQTAGLSLIAKF